MTNDIATTLAQRGEHYGEFRDVATIAQSVKSAMWHSSNWLILADDQREALDMIANKVARILNGDADHHDSWHDIAGYATLVADRLAGEVGQ